MFRRNCDTCRSSTRSNLHVFRRQKTFHRLTTTDSEDEEEIISHYSSRQKTPQMFHYRDHGNVHCVLKDAAFIDTTDFTCFSARPRHLHDDCGWKTTNTETLTREMRNPKALPKAWGTANKNLFLMFIFLFIFSVFCSPWFIFSTLFTPFFFHPVMKAHFIIGTKTVRSISGGRWWDTVYKYETR